ncbi:MAG TPA: hypothetical protein VGP72_01905 [Planctomycetota bacterium]|jgi:hypothetical protein
MNQHIGQKCIPWLSILLALPAGVLCRGAEESAISVVTDAAPGLAASHGLSKLQDVLRAKDVTFEKVNSLTIARGKTLVVVGVTTGDGPAAQLLKAAQAPALDGPEALAIRRAEWQGTPAWVIGGSDDRGVMYGALNVAERIGWSDRSAPLRELRETTERPSVSERALSIYTMNRAYWESRFYDEEYWARYLDLLAQNRFNSLVVIFGYENGGFLAPAYPYFFDVAEFPDVRMVGVTPEQQERSLAALNRLVAMTHERGLNFTVGLWDHIYRGGVQGGGVPGANDATKQPMAGLVWGVTEKNLIAYTQAALTKFVRLVPKLDAIQFRMHDESGLKNREQEEFWRKIFEVMKEHAPNVRFDARAKGLPDSVIETGLNLGVKLRITTKYWMEQMGLPFHPTHINRPNQFDRRHSYADLLRYPQRYKMHWRLWNGGTSRVLLWGDPDYARRFAASTHLYDGDGFEVNEPLCTKMEAQPHDAKPFELLKAPYRYYDYEFERYWHFFQVFGRLGYNPDTPAEVWQREFEKRFGKDAAPFVEKGLRRASQILPRIVAACYPYSYFPMTRGWAEKQRLGDLPAYAKAEGSDTQQFASFDEEAQNLIEGNETAKTRPPTTSRWFAQTAADINAQIAEAEKRIGAVRSKEFDVTVVDLKILANLALFHARRIPAAVSYRLFERTKDGSALDQAIAHERSAVEAWRQLVAAAGDVYADDLMMGVRGAALCGHWRDELTALEKGLAALERQRQDFRPVPGGKASPHYDALSGAGDHEPPMVVHQPITRAAAGKPLTISAEVRDPSGVKWVRLRYRSVNQHHDYQTLAMLPAGEKDRYQAVVPAEHLVAAWDFMYFIEVMDNQGNGGIYPDLKKETPYIVVRLLR